MRRPVKQIKKELDKKHSQWCKAFKKHADADPGDKYILLREAEVLKKELVELEDELYGKWEPKSRKIKEVVDESNVDG